MIVALIGPYETYGDKAANIAHAREIAAELWRLGHAVLCPHMNTGGLEDEVPRERFLLGDKVLLSVCDAAVLLRDWQLSEGAQDEQAYAYQLGISLYGEDDLPALHDTEQQSPVQVARFREELGVMMRTHLAKNADYSSNGILGMGTLGVVVRAWDKISRLLHLHGVRIRVEHEGYTAPREAANEAVEDSWRDLANYAVIGCLVREGTWGR